MVKCSISRLLLHRPQIPIIPDYSHRHNPYFSTNAMTHAVQSVWSLRLVLRFFLTFTYALAFSFVGECGIDSADTSLLSISNGEYTTHQKLPHTISTLTDSLLNSSMLNISLK